MKRLLQIIGLADPDPSPVLNDIYIVKKDLNDIDMEAFSKWCKDLGVTSRARTSEFTVLIGNHEKIVSLDRF